MRKKTLQEMREHISNIREDIVNMEMYVSQIAECIGNNKFIPEELNMKMIDCLEFHEKERMKCKDLYITLYRKNMELETITQYEEAIESAEKQMVMDEHSCILKPFLKLHSNTPKIEQLLNNEKEKIGLYLERNDKSDIDEKISIYKDFYEAIIEIDKLNEADLYMHMSKMMPYFDGDLVLHAFVIKDIYMENNESQGSILEEKENQNLPLDNGGDIIEIAEKTYKEELGDIESSLFEQSAMLPICTEFEPLEIKKSTREEKKFGVKDFKYDLNNGSYTKLEKQILQMISKYNIVTEEIIKQQNSDLPDKMVGLAFEHLLARGYLRKNILNHKYEFYCVTNKCKKAFLSKDARSFLNLRGNEYFDDIEIDEGDVYAAITRYILAKIIEKKCVYCSMEKLSIRKELYRDAFALKVYNKNSYNALEYIVGFINIDKGGMCSLKNTCDSFFVDKGDIKKIIFASINLEYAIGLCKIFLSKYTELTETEKYIYSLEADKFYSIDGKTEIFAENIWNEVKEGENLEEDEVIELDEVIIEEEKISNVDFIITDSKKEKIKENKIEIDVESVYTNAYKMIADNKIYCASAYLKAYSDRSVDAETLWNKLAYAINDPLLRCSYSTDKLYDVFFDVENKIHDYLLVSAALRTFFYNHVEYDYSMKTFYEGNIQSLQIVKSCKELSDVLHKIVEFKNREHKGMDVYADYRMKDNVLLERNILKVKQEAKRFYEDRILVKASENASHKRFIETKKLIFSLDGDIATYIKAIYENDIELNPFIEEFLKESFIKNNLPIDVANIDSNKIEDYIDEYWDKASEKMRVVRKSSDLMSSLRQNLFNVIYIAITILCKWISYTSRLDDSTDLSFVEYKKIRSQLLKNISESCDYFARKSLTLDNVEEYAGCQLLISTLEELHSRVDGTYDESEWKYFYINFLKADYVLLDDDYLPVLDLGLDDESSIKMTERIYEHANALLGNFEQRLHNIFMEYGDDFGSAKLILDYLHENKLESIPNEKYDIVASIEYGLRDIENCKQKFIENLELMQSYGQIDNSIENKKDKFLQMVMDVYEYAILSKNFGFFKKVTKAFEVQIKEDAKCREDSLIAELDKYKKYLQDNDEHEKLVKLEKVREMLELQNYTVAEDLLSRIKRGESDVDIAILPKDYLADFIERNDYYKGKVSDISRSLGSIVSNRIRNKDTKGGRRLVDNWPDNNGVKPSADRLRNLLLFLGFSVGDIKEQPKIGKLDNYIVYLQQPINGRKTYFKHPISAFGSKAISDGFRVVFMFGRTDPDRLIAAFREIGNAKNTLILLDYPLSLQDRRTLARRIKKEVTGKIFGVLDRVLLLYLAENYNEEYVNQMLLSIMMPFAYAQPYVWESASVMPPEIFIGRTEELEKIESPSGVNIVYGGRQLGKSALLRMAKNDINNDENGNRAVLVDIKGLDYRKAAKKIGEALYDDGVIDIETQTDDWDELSRIIQKRLKQERNKIPYLLLLIDEADTFIESCESINYHPFDALKDIQSVGVDRFKFVIAGLRNIVRFKRETALGNNSVLTHLESTTVIPFKYTEARELLEVPLYYLGLRFSGDKEALISSIFANANYFPGLIQLYCAKLIEAMRKGDYAGYNEVNSPIYEVEKEHIKKVLAEEGFLQQIREKFIITLKLDEDNYYYIIALLLAQLYHENGYNSGYTADDIREEGTMYDIYKVMNLELETIKAFMEEMCELNVLRRNSKDEYLFNRYSFFQMMGSKQEVEDKLMEYMGE